jgi:anti-anti-sigma factor
MTVHEFNDIILLQPEGNLWEGAECDTMERTLLELAERGKRVIVDLSGTRLITAHCLGVYAHAKQTALTNGGEIVLCRASRVQSWLLKKTGLAETLTIYEDRAAAMRALEQRPRAVA